MAPLAWFVHWRNVAAFVVHKIQPDEKSRQMGSWGRAAAAGSQSAPHRVGRIAADRPAHRRRFDIDTRARGGRPAARLCDIGPPELFGRSLSPTPSARRAFTQTMCVKAAGTGRSLGGQQVKRPAHLSLSRCGWRSGPSTAAIDNRKARVSVPSDARVSRPSAPAWFPTR